MNDFWFRIYESSGVLYRNSRDVTSWKVVPAFSGNGTWAIVCYFGTTVAQTASGGYATEQSAHAALRALLNGVDILSITT